MTPPSWERPAEGESARSFGWFVKYRAAGPDRSLARLRFDSGPGKVPPLSTLKEWSSRHRWGARVAAFDAHLAGAAAVEAEQVAREQGRTGAEVARQVREHVGRLLDKAEVLSAADLLHAARALEALSRVAPDQPPTVPTVHHVHQHAAPMSPEAEHERVVGVLSVLAEAGVVSLPPGSTEAGWEPGAEPVWGPDGEEPVYVPEPHAENGGPPPDDPDEPDSPWRF